MGVNRLQGNRKRMLSPILSCLLTLYTYLSFLLRTGKEDTNGHYNYIPEVQYQYTELWTRRCKKVRRDENTTSRKDESPTEAKKGKTANYTAQHETVPKVEHHDFPRQSLPGCHGFLGGRRVQDIAKLG